MKKTFTVAAIALLFLTGCVAQEPKETKPVRIGWISDLTGPVAKWGALEAAMIAVDEINEQGGIDGRTLELITEDGKCNPTAAVQAMNKLVNIDQVSIVLGGHCSPESLAIAPIAQQQGVLMLASLTTSPDFSNSGELIFRTSPVNTAQSRLIAKHLRNEKGFTKLAVLYEETGYAQPIAEVLQEEFTDRGGEIVAYESFTSDVNDYRSSLTKIKHAQPDALFISPQDQGKAGLILKQMEELDINIPLYGNEIIRNPELVEQYPERMEGVIFGEPAYDGEGDREKAFAQKYADRYDGAELPFGIYTAENYDAVMLIADAIREHGEDPEAIAEYLENVKDYDGVSGVFSIDENHDGDRQYVLKHIKNGKVEEYKTI